MEWRIRIHNVTNVRTVSWALHYATSYLIVHHEGGSERPHFHLWMQTEFAEQTIRKLPKHLNLTNGNSDFSIQKCDPTRRDEYLQYMFNLKNGNKPTFVAEKGVPQWKEYEERAAQSTVEYVANKKKEKAFTKNDMIEYLINNPPEAGYHTEEELFDEIIKVSRNHKTVFSINAMREIIVYTGWCRGDKILANNVRASVLKIFHPN